MKRRNNKKVTIYDVADAAGVSKSTVSRYISGRHHEISEKTKKKISEVIEKLQYRPSQMARGLKVNRSFLIGAIVADITNPFTTAILRGAEDIAKENGYSLLICNSDNHPEKEQEYISMLQSQRIDGLIIQTTGGNYEFLQSLFSNGETPIVLVDREIPELPFDSVQVNHALAIRDATHFLLKQNYERIAYFTEKTDDISARKERLQAFQHTLLEAKGNASFMDDIYEINIKDENDFYRKIDLFLTSAQKQSKVFFAANSMVLLKAITYFQQIGVHVPQDIALMGFDNPDWTHVVLNGISTIEQPTYQIGVKACELIIKRMKDEERPQQQHIFEATMHIRQTTPLCVPLSVDLEH